MGKNSSNLNFIRKDDLTHKGPGKTRKGAIEIDGTDGPGVPDPMAILRLVDENKRGLNGNPNNPTLKEQIAWLDKDYMERFGVPTAISVLMQDKKAQNKENQAIFLNQTFANKIQQNKGKKQCNDLQKAISRA